MAIAPFKSLQAWANRIVSSELFDAAMMKFTPWQHRRGCLLAAADSTGRKTIKKTAP